MGDVVQFRRGDGARVVEVLFGKNAAGGFFADFDKVEIRAESIDELVRLVAQRLKREWRAEEKKR